ncbi:MAG TPA: tetratricopeptide repeat protein [Burkholderiaceae bacterium]|jgi:tetratricopeptide (TPR) repeat protein|nr:tetratricopeptide repeat protein [Burkholderiaceae bacterium]
MTSAALQSCLSLATEAAILHQGGKLGEAERLYRLILEFHPEHSDALHLLGVLMRQKGEHQAAVDLIEKSINLNPGYAVAHYNLGNALLQMKLPTDALRSYNAAIHLQPTMAAAHSNKGDVLRDLGRLDEALRSYDQAVQWQPELAVALCHRASVLAELVRFDEALDSYHLAILSQPDFSDAFNGRAIVLAKLGRHDEALPQYDKALQINPDFAEAHFNRANSYFAQNRPDEALVDYDKAIEIRPDFAEAFDNRGCALEKLGRLEEALSSHETALRFRPGFAVALNNRGNILCKLNRFEEALSSFDKAIAINPGFFQAVNNRSLALCDLLRHDEALNGFRRAHEIAPGDPDVHFHIGLCHLLLGDYESGWKEHEWRWKRKKSIGNRNFSAPLWLGQETLAEKTILLHAEQGFGDTIQFCRYVQAVASLGATVLLEVPAALRSLLSKLDGVTQLICRTEPLPAFDYHCPLMSLPLAMNTRLDSIPNESPYLTADPNLVSVWSERLGKRTGLRVGLAWSGRIDYANDYRRSMPLSAMSGILNEGAQFISLQQEVRAEDWPALYRHVEIAHFGKHLVDFSETAALIGNMDLVISVDTCIAHLAGAMGKPVWIPLSYKPDWRWLLHRSDSPWYPAAKLFRQSMMGDWNSVIAKMRDRLQDLLIT